MKLTMRNLERGLQAAVNLLPIFIHKISNWKGPFEYDNKNGGAVVALASAFDF